MPVIMTKNHGYEGMDMNRIKNANENERPHKTF